MLKNVTLSAEESLIRKAREKAVKEKRSLNAAFREWLERYVGIGKSGSGYRTLMQKLSYAQPGRKFSRQEMNER